jgi:hypothetical protein
MKRKAIPLVLALGLAVLGLAILGAVEFRYRGLFPAHDYALEIKSVPELRARIERRVRCHLPEPARELHMMSDGGPDATLWISFQVPPASLAALKSEISDTWTDQLDCPLPRPVPQSARSWWSPPSTNISIYWDGIDPDPSKRKVSGLLWIIDEAKGVIYFCSYAS